MDDSTKTILDEIKSLGSEYKKFKKELKKLEDKAGKLEGLGEWKIIFPGLVKAYADAVKSSDGLTSLKPSCAKAIETAEKKPTVDSVKSAMKSVSEHMEEFKKAAKTDKKAAEFVKQMGALEKKLEKAL